MQSNQFELTKLFAEKFHLNVEDRNALHDGAIYGSELVDAIAKIVEEKEKYPPEWSIDSPFDGGLIERKENNSFRLTWQAEVGVCRFEVVLQKDFKDIKSASRELAKRFFGSNYDGIKIDWSK